MIAQRCRPHAMVGRKLVEEHQRVLQRLPVNLTRHIAALAFSPSGRFERFFVLGQVLVGELTAMQPGYVPGKFTSRVARFPDWLQPRRSLPGPYTLHGYRSSRSGPGRSRHGNVHLSPAFL